MKLIISAQEIEKSPPSLNDANTPIQKPAIIIKMPRTTIFVIGCSEALKFAIKTLIMTSTSTVSITISYQDNLQISQLKKRLS